MARPNFIIKELEEKGIVSYTANGNSMTPRIYTKSKLELKKVDPKALRVGDMVYCRVKGSHFVHLLTAIDENKNRFKIENNHGYVNGWIGPENIFGICVKIGDKTILTDEEINNRLHSK
jgi:hypothetical protein